MDPQIKELNDVTLRQILGRSNAFYNLPGEGHVVGKTFTVPFIYRPSETFYRARLAQPDRDECE